MSFTIGSLFSGSGGFELAATMCGGVPIWASEIEPFPIAVTKSRFPNMKHLGSVTDVKGDEVDPVDVITFGSPCQDLSVAGKRAGLKHEDNGDEETTRSGLFMEAVRIIKEMRKATNGVYPRFAIWENVPGAFSSNKGEDFRTVCEELIKIVEPGAVMPAVPKNGWPYADCYCGEGWSLAYRVYDAQYWGVPQRRRRIYLVVDFAGECAGKISFEREGLRGYFTEGRTPWKGTAADAEGCPGTDDREGERNCIAFHLLQDPIPNSKVSPCMGQGNSGVGQASIGVCYGVNGVDVYNKSLTGDKDKTLNAAACDSDHIPCVIEAMGYDRYNQCSTGNVCETLRTPGGGDNYPVACISVCTYDARGNGDGQTVNTLTGDHNNRITDYSTLVCEPAGTFQNTGVGWWNETPVGATLRTPCGGDATLANVVVEKNNRCVVFDKEVYNSGVNAAGGAYIADGGPAPSLRTEHPPGVCIRYIVRRLTPTECARLQGFADRWAVPVSKDNFTDEEYTFWLNVRNTHAEINGKATKDYTKEQMLTWYNKLHTDSSEYKLWGNGIALPTALYVMQGISDVINQ